MKLENQVVSLDLAKRLKELGVKQESAFMWLQRKPETADEKPYWYLKGNGQWPVGMKIYNSVSAFTVAEVGKMLPNYIHFLKTQAGKHLVRWTETEASEVIDAGRYHQELADTEADARAKMLIHLLENKLIALQSTMQS